MDNIIKKKAKQLWGNDLHKNKSIPPHSPQFQSLFGSLWTDSLKGNLLEIGCGSGADLEIFKNIDNLKSIHAIDIGANIEQLVEKYKDEDHMHIKKGDATNLDFESSTFDLVYSFGVFHHTEDPIKCLSETFRVLNQNGTAFIYLYSKHGRNLFKKLGIHTENLIMRIINLFPYSVQSLICIILSPICWALFYLPSKILYLLGFNNLYNKFPFYFATHPFSLIGDLKDRLMSPINHRFSKSEIERILANCGFGTLIVKENSSGIYIYAKK